MRPFLSLGVDARTALLNERTAAADGAVGREWIRNYRTVLIVRQHQYVAIAIDKTGAAPVRRTAAQQAQASRLIDPKGRDKLASPAFATQSAVRGVPLASSSVSVLIAPSSPAA